MPSSHRIRKRSLRNAVVNRAVVLLAVAYNIGCHHPIGTAPRPIWMSEEYCWWAVLRSTLPPDSVAARFQRAYAALSLTDVNVTTRADTAWARAGPTLLNNRQFLNRRQYASRVVAYRHGDSTHLRYYVAVATKPGDSVEVARGFIGFCGEVARAAAIGWWAPRSPTGDESLKVWTRIP